MSRAMLHGMIRLLPSVSDTEKAIAKIAKQVQRIDRKNPAKAHGHHMMVKAMMYVARGRKDTSSETCL